MPDLRVPLLANVLADLERRTPGTPDGVAKALRTHWFDQFCGCFQALFKNDGKVQGIVLGKLLAGVAVHQGANGAFDPNTVSQKLLAGITPALRPLLEEFTQRIEDSIGDLKLDTGKILAILQQRPPTPAPAPTSTHALTGNLPQRRLFVGRRSYLDTIKQRLRTDETINIVSLRGVPGVGKTAIALEYAHRSAADFPDGCFWLDARSGDANNALRTMLVTSGVASSDELGGQFADICRLWRERSDGRRLLLVIDNAEKLVASQRDLLERLSPAAPARTLVTSRVAIDPSRDVRIDILSEDDALALLHEHGVEVAVQPAEAAALATRLGYLALALNITAQRMALFTPRRTCAQALADFERSGSILEQLRLPRTNSVDDNAAESFALSYAMLDERLRETFHALGSCAPSGAPVSALAVLLNTDESEVQDLALALGALSLAEYDGTRVELHPLLHEYARIRLHGLPAQEQRFFVRHVAYFGQGIGGAYQCAVNEDRGADASEALNVFDRERDNVELAQVRALANGFPDPQLAVEVTDDLTRVWRLRDNTRLLDWLTHALALATTAGLTHRQANVLQAIGDVQSFRKEIDAALASYAEALRLFTAVGDKLGQANVLLAQGRLLNDTSLLEHALALYEEIRDGYSIARCKYFLAILCLQQGASERGVQLLLDARALWEQIDFTPGIEAIEGILRQVQGP